MCSLYRMVVFPAASSPSITTRISLFPNSLSNACLNDLNTVCADGAFPIVAGRFRRRTRATTRLRRAERAPSRRLPRPLSPREPRESPSASGGRARGPGAPTAPDLARRRLTRTGGTKRVQCDDEDSTTAKEDFRSSRSLVCVSKTLVERLIADLSRLGNCPYERTHHFSTRLAHVLGCDQGVQVVVASRAVPTPVARVPRAFPTHETPASVSRRFRRDDA